MNIQNIKLNASDSSLRGKYHAGGLVLIECDGTNGSFAVTMPDVLNTHDVEFVFIKTDDSENGIAVNFRNNQAFIDGEEFAYLLTRGATVTLIPGLTGWVRVGSGETDHALLSNLNSTNYTHLTAVNALDLTDGGETSLHRHTNGNTGVCFTVFNATTSVGVSIGVSAFTVPAIINGWNLTDVTASVYEKGVTGTTDVQIRRRRNGIDADMLSTKITIGDEFFADDEIVDTAHDDVVTGDQIYIDVDAVHSGTAPKGLSVSLSFQKV